MNQQTSSETDQTQLTPEMIISYLQQHPDFFLQQEELLLSIRIPHASGKAISLVEHQLNRLRNRNQELQQQLNHLLDTARENDKLFEKTRRLILELLQSNSLDNLTASLEDSLRHDFNVDATSFILFGDNNPFAGRSIKLSDAQDKLGSLLNTDAITTGQFRENILDFLFGSNTTVKSAAFIPLRNVNPLGILVLGSNDPQRYQRETGTLFLNQISDVLCRLLPNFLPNSSQQP